MFRETNFNAEYRRRLLKLKVEFQLLTTLGTGLQPPDLARQAIELQEKFIGLCTEWQKKIAENHLHWMPRS